MVYVVMHWWEIGGTLASQPEAAFSTEVMARDFVEAQKAGPGHRYEYQGVALDSMDA